MTEWTIRGTDDAGSFVETLHLPPSTALSTVFAEAFDTRARQGRSDITIAYADPFTPTYALEPCWP